MDMQHKTLFILKKRGTSYGGSSFGVSVPLKSSGLLNSARFVHDMLVRQGKDCKLVEVVDNNDIDREVTMYRPSTVIIEAFWVIPSKFEVLRKRHPTVKWVIRSHSEIPFFAGEGISITWFYEYMKQENVTVAFNTRRTTNEFQMLYALTDTGLTQDEVNRKVIYLPNFYPIGGTIEPYQLDSKDTIDVGCFGAIRPFKNHVLQAVAAIDYAEQHGLNLRFHINSTRIEGNADNHKKNLIAVFDGLDPNRFQLVQHDWLSHEDFTKLVRTMDIGLQMSFTESFNIVAADFVNAGIPIVVSEEIKWVAPLFQADCTSSTDIVTNMKRALWYKKWIAKYLDVNLAGLRNYCESAKNVWIDAVSCN